MSLSHSGGGQMGFYHEEHTHLADNPTQLGAKKVIDVGQYAIKITTAGSITYIGQAAPGSTESSAVWQCKKIDSSSGVVFTWADGNSKFDNVATDLTALTYS